MSVNSSRSTPYTITTIRPDGVELVGKIRLRSDAVAMAEALAAICPDWSTVRVETREEIVADFPGTVEGMARPYSDAASRRRTLAADFTADQIATVTRGLSVVDYARAFNLGYDSNRSDDDLDKRLWRYLNAAYREPAQESAWLDGNTYGDETAEEFIRLRIRGQI